MSRQSFRQNRKDSYRQIRRIKVGISDMLSPLCLCKKSGKKYCSHLNEIGLTYTQYIAMMVFWEKGRCGTKKLGEKLYLDSDTLTPVLKSLERYFCLFNKCRNLIPVLSMRAAKRKRTDSRRGQGIYDKLISNMENFKSGSLLLGASVAVTTENVKEENKHRLIKISFKQLLFLLTSYRYDNILLP